MIDYASALNDEQRQVVEQGDGPCLVLAGAGSGKTRTIIYRVAYLLEQGVDPSSILLLTFTNKAAREMSERLYALTGIGTQTLWAGTFHSIANRLLRLYAPLIGYTTGFSILDQDDSKALLKTCVKDAKVPSGDKRFPSVAVLQGLVSYAKNADRPIGEVLQKRGPTLEAFTAQIEDIARRYEEKKRQANGMDFDDLLLRLRDLLVNHPDVERQLSERFRYILVDEYQDTNALQAGLVARLAQTHQNVLVVGDDAQSIYSFRAADIQNILQFPKLFAGAKTFRLEVNYRSTPEILRLANESISYNAHQFEKTLRTDNLSGAKPNMQAYPSTAAEARGVVQTVQSRLGAGLAPSAMAVLFRAAYQSQAVEFELMREGIAYEYRGGLRFFERAHVKDVLAFLRVQENPLDTAAWLRMGSLQVGVGPVTAQKVAEYMAGVRPEDWEREEIMQGAGAKVAHAWTAIRSMGLPVWKAPSIAEQLRAFLGTDYVNYLEQTYPNAAERLMDLEQLARFAETYESRAQLLEDVSLTDVFGATVDQKKSAPKLVLSTIHQAKGLEWDTVFVLSLADGSFPNKRALGRDEDMQEERRLFYVAVTRAKQSLFLSYAAGSFGDAVAGPSPFLLELPSGLVQESVTARLFGSPKMQYHNQESGWAEPVIVLEDAPPSRPRSSGGFLKDY